MATKAPAAPLTGKQRAERNRAIRFEISVPGATSEEVAARWGVSASYVRALAVGGIHPRDGGPIRCSQPPLITKAARRKLLETALDSRRLFGTDPKFADVQQAVLGEPKVLSGRRRVRVQRLLQSALRCVDRVISNIGPKDPATGCAKWCAGTRERTWVNRDDTPRSVRYPFVADPADNHALLDPKRLLAQLASIPLQPRQRIRMSCGDHMCMAVEHFVIGGERRGK